MKSSAPLHPLLCTNVNWLYSSAMHNFIPLDRPPYNLDLSPIVYLWDELDRMGMDAPE